jgi:O-antigen ligase
LLFLVLVQRIKTLADAERVICAAAAAGVAMGAFALAQYATSNEKFFWVIDHPYMTTSHCALGCFTNRNHLAQYLALSIGPLIWCILRRFHTQEQAGDDGLAPQLHGMAVLSLLAGLGVTILASLLCFSRGGVLSLSVATIVSFGLLCRMGLASAKLAIGLVVAAGVVAGIFFMTGFETLENRLEGTLSTNSKEGRFEIWQANIAVARDFPVLGTGLGTHVDAYHLNFNQANDDSMEYTHAESGYLQVASESGLSGLGVAFSFILVSLGLCLRGLWHPDIRHRSIAAAVLASLLANVSHAAFDFFWYAPSCMLLLAVQLAAVLRISRAIPDAESHGDNLPMRGFRLPRIVTLVAGAGIAAAGGWMLLHKIPAAQAEPDRMRYLYLSQERTDGEEDDVDLAEERGDLLLRAARLDPTDSRLQESAGIEYLRRFDLRQTSSENPLAFGQIRDVVKSSEFKSKQEMKEWMNRAVGHNTRYLHLANRSFRRAIQASPLRAGSYVKAAELGFLNLTSDEDDMAILKQGLKVRPYDAEILFQVGRNVMLTGDIDGALVYWRDAFSRSRIVQNVIVRQLAPQVDPEFFMENLNPDWEAQGLVARAYDEIDRKDEARAIWEKHIREGMKRLKASMPEEKLELTALSLHDACTAIEDTDLAIQVLQRGLQRAPQSYLIRHRLAWDLYTAERYEEAADHLKWCASRRPDDDALQEAAALVTKQSLKHARGESRSKSG